MTEHSAETATAPTRRAASTKVATVEKLLSRPKGASLTAIMEATGLHPHSARVFMTGLRNKGHSRFSSSPDQARILMSIQVTRQKASAATESLAERQEFFQKRGRAAMPLSGSSPDPAYDRSWLECRTTAFCNVAGDPRNGQRRRT